MKFEFRQNESNLKMYIIFKGLKKLHVYKLYINYITLFTIRSLKCFNTDYWYQNNSKLSKTVVVVSHAASIIYGI